MNFFSHEKNILEEHWHITKNEKMFQAICWYNFSNTWLLLPIDFNAHHWYSHWPQMWNYGYTLLLLLRSHLLLKGSSYSHRRAGSSRTPQRNIVSYKQFVTCKTIWFLFHKIWRKAEIRPPCIASQKAAWNTCNYGFTFPLFILLCTTPSSSVKVLFETK